MNKFLTLAMAGIFILSLQGPVRAQKEVPPPPISPLLEGQRPLEHVERKEPAAPHKPKPKKAKVKSKKKRHGAKAKKRAVKRRHTIAKKKHQKAGKKKRPAVSKRRVGPDEG